MTRESVGSRIRVKCHTPLAAAKKLYHYVVVRADLPRGHLAAQIVHAAGESAASFDFRSTPTPVNSVVLSARDEAQLRVLEDRLIADGTQFTAIREPDMGDSLTAIGFPIQSREGLKNLLRALPLLR